ncbi:MAG: archease [Candidatus Bipolaricaulota bacterium]
MPYEILEHTADAGVRGIGADAGEAFAEAARGMFSLMVSLAAVRPHSAVEVELEADSLEALLVSWLGELLAQRDIEGLMFSRFQVQMHPIDGRWRLRGRAWGEPLDVKRHEPQVEVKAATNYGVRVEQAGNRTIAQCVLDL